MPTRNRNRTGLQILLIDDEETEMPVSYRRDQFLTLKLEKWQAGLESSLWRSSLEYARERTLRANPFEATIESYEQAIQDGEKHVKMLEDALKWIVREAEPSRCDPSEMLRHVGGIAEEALKGGG